MLSTYFRHYKLYQYAFTDLVRMDVEPMAPILRFQRRSRRWVSAYPKEEWAEKQAELAERAAEKKRLEEEEAAAIEEAEREARLKAEYEAAIPEEVTTRWRRRLWRPWKR